MAKANNYSRKSVSLPNVPGLPEPYASLLKRTVKVFQSKLKRNLLRSRYYDQKNSLKDLGISIPPPLANNQDFQAAIEWPEKAVSALQCRSRFDSFVGNGADAVNAIFKDARFFSKYPMLVTSELKHSCAFASVTPGIDGKVKIALYSACNAAALWDYDNDRILCGLTVTKVDKYNQPTGYNLFTSDAIVVLTKPEPNKNEWAFQILPHAMGRPLFVSFSYQPSLERPFGVSRISRAVMSITDEAVRESLRLSIASEFAVAPQRYILGADDDLLDDIPEWQAYIGAILALTRDEDGNIPTVGQFPQVTMQPHTDLMRLCAARMSGATDIPLNNLGIVHDNPASAEAITAANEQLIIKAEGLNKVNGDALTDLAIMAYCIANNTLPAALTDAEKDITPKFLSPAYPSVVSQADGVIKMASVIEGFGASDVAMELFGLTDEQIKRIKQDRMKAQAVNVINSLSNALPEE